VFAELAVWEPRPELQRLCVAALDRGRLDGQRSWRRRLPGLSERAYANLMRSLAYLQLVDGQGRLTAFGRRCAETGEAPARGSRASTTSWSPSTPWCGGVILAFDRADSDGQDRDFSNLAGVPAWLPPSREHVHTSVFDRSRFSLAAFPSPRNEAPKCRGPCPARRLADLDSRPDERATPAGSSKARSLRAASSARPTCR
jgi:hypothetical protein